MLKNVNNVRIPSQFDSDASLGNIVSFSGDSYRKYNKCGLRFVLIKNKCRALRKRKDASSNNVSFFSLSSVREVKIRRPLFIICTELTMKITSVPSLYLLCLCSSQRINIEYIAVFIHHHLSYDADIFLYVSFNDLYLSRDERMSWYRNLGNSNSQSSNQSSYSHRAFPQLVDKWKIYFIDCTAPLFKLSVNVRRPTCEHFNGS